MDKKLIEEFDRKQKASKHKHKKDSHKAKKPKIEEPEPAQPSTSYRDRAKERREGLNKDFEHDPDDLRLFNPILESAPQEDDPGFLDDDERRLQEIEDSKYLGGDVEHTHLVKGLDFALLEKVKNDQKLLEKSAKDEETEAVPLFGDAECDSEEEEFRMEAILAASAAGGEKRQILDLEKLKKGQSTEVIPCRTALARRILNVMDEKWPNRSELFIPGRMTYVVPIDGDCEDTTVTTILKSKTDAAAPDDTEPESDLALDYLVNLLGRIRRGEHSNSDSSKKVKGWRRDDEINDYGY